MLNENAISIRDTEWMFFIAGIYKLWCSDSFLGTHIEWVSQNWNLNAGIGSFQLLLRLLTDSLLESVCLLKVLNYSHSILMFSCIDTCTLLFHRNLIEPCLKRDHDILVPSLWQWFPIIGSRSRNVGTDLCGWPHLGLQ